MKLLITEEEKRHIMSLYEGVTFACTPEDMKVYENLVNTLYPEQLSSAIKWWDEWLKSPITKNKFIKNNPDVQDPNKIFEGYFNILKNIKIVPYGKCSKNIGPSEQYAYVKPNDSSPNIYVNATFSDLEQQTILEILVHEVQHLLYFYHPLNPSVKVDNCFTPKTYVKGGIFQKVKNLFNTTKKLNNKINNNISSTLQIPLESAQKIQKYILQEIEVQKSRGREDYISNDNENLSRIMGIRQKFNIKPGVEITKEQFMPYFNNLINSKTPDKYFSELNKTDTNFYWLILYWGYKGFTDLNSLLSGLNSLAYQKNNKRDENIT